MQAPTIADLLRHSFVQQALEQAWVDSLPKERSLRHEEGGWIYCDVSTGAFSFRRALAGGQAFIDLSTPPIVSGSVVVATFHTHPNPTAEGWTPQPSDADIQSAWILGVPCLIRADDGIYSTGPDSRRGGLTGAAGYPV